MLQDSFSDRLWNFARCPTFAPAPGVAEIPPGSTVIVTAGLILDTPAIIIGGMVVTPLLTPILTTSLAILLLDWRLLWRSLATTVISLLVVFLTSFLLAKFFTVSDSAVSLEIMSRTNFHVLYILIAVFSGVAAAYAWAKPKLSAVLPGIAVAVALLPPLSVVGIGIRLSDSYLSHGAIKFFLYNWVGVVVGSFFVFLFLGFIATRKKVEKVIDQSGKENLKKG